MTELFNNPVLVGLIVAWVLVWKGIALWIAARAGSKPWFIALLLINTLGLLEILYIFLLSRRRLRASPA